MKAFQLHYEEKRRCLCGREFYCQQSFDFATRRYCGNFVYCPGCDSPFEHKILESNFREKAQALLKSLEGRKPGEMLTDGVSVKKARAILRFLV